MIGCDRAIHVMPFFLTIHNQKIYSRLDDHLDGNYRDKDKLGLLKTSNKKFSGFMRYFFSDYLRYFFFASYTGSRGFRYLGFFSGISGNNDDDS
jgi:hypothetical protein